MKKTNENKNEEGNKAQTGQNYLTTLQRLHGCCFWVFWLLYWLYTAKTVCVCE